MARYKLTVAIPTYNRPKQLGHTLSVVLPQVLAHDEVQLLVLDNCSPVPAEDVLKEVGKGIDLPERVRVIRHRSNIGGNPNIIRCFEVSDGDWLWCLSDDDEPAVDAVDTILSDVRNGDHCYGFYNIVNNASDLRDCPSGKYVGSSLSEWVRRIPAYGHRLFISAAVFRLEAVRPYLLWAYQTANSGAPHLVMAFLAMLHGGTYQLSSKSIVSYVPPAQGSGYNCAPLAYGSVALIPMVGTVCTPEDFKIFFSDGFAEWVSPFRLLADVIKLHGGLTGALVHRYFGLIVRQFKPKFFVRPKSWFRWTTCQMFSCFPKLFRALIERRYRKKGCGVIGGRVA